MPTPALDNKFDRLYTECVSTKEMRVTEERAANEATVSNYPEGIRNGF